VISATAACRQGSFRVPHRVLSTPVLSAPDGNYTLNVDAHALEMEMKRDCPNLKHVSVKAQMWM